jgi:polyisoprenoid-binding protein YceI
MQRFKLSYLLLIGTLPLLFSCERKSGIDAQKNPDTTEITSAPKKEAGSATTWSIDDNQSKVSFTIKNMGMDVNGTIGGLKGLIAFDPANLKNSRFETAVEVNTINTGIDKRDKDLMEEKFLDQKNFKQITFRSDSIIKTGNGYEAIGDLTIKGYSEHRKIDFMFEQNGDNGIFKSNLTFNRMDYGIGGSGPVMGSDVHVTIYVVTKKNNS